MKWLSLSLSQNKTLHLVLTSLPPPPFSTITTPLSSKSHHELALRPFFPPLQSHLIPVVSNETNISSHFSLLLSVWNPLVVLSDYRSANRWWWF